MKNSILQIASLQANHCCTQKTFRKMLSSAVLFIALFLFSVSTFGQTTIINYDFNSGTDFATLNSNAISGITSTMTGDAFTITASGTTTGSNAFTANGTSGNA